MSNLGVLNSNVSFEGIDESIVTFFAETEIKPGELVTIVKDNTVKAASDNENFIGVCISCKNSIVAVKISGYQEIKIKNLSSIKYGRQYFVSDSDSSLKLSDNTNLLAVPLNVVMIDKTSSIIGVFL